ncbi:MAG: DUF3822 family protein [Bacteroidales bacterium]|nr:DUF3822 family protein [Bacteroidales bacterium]
MDTLLSNYYKKSIRLTPDGFSLFKQQDNGKMVREDYPAGENALLSTKAPEFFKLDNGEMQTIDIIVGTHVPMLVPDVIFDEAKAKDYLNMQFDLTHYGQHFSDQLGQYRSLYFLTQNEYSTISSLNCIPQYVSEGTILYRYLMDLGKPESLLISVNDSFVDFIALHGGAPSLVNRTTRTENVDILYYSLNCMQQFALMESTLFVHYFSKNNKKLNDLLGQYHKNVVIL